MPNSIKALTLIAMGLFLYSRYFTGSLLYYINERFVWLTVLASFGFILVGVSYRYRTEYLPHHHDGHDHGDHHHGHIGWGGLLLVSLPIVLGLLIPPQPLGAAAMSNREVSLKSLTSAPAAAGPMLTRPKGENNILDWVVAFRSAPDLSRFTGQEAQVIGFVYRDQRMAADEFMVSRFVLSCCAADAAPLGLVVRSPQAAELPTDQWVQVRGHFEPGQLDGEEIPILMAAEITPTEVPDQPYLYPY